MCPLQKQFVYHRNNSLNIRRTFAERSFVGAHIYALEIIPFNPQQSSILPIPIIIQIDERLFLCRQ